MARIRTIKPSYFLNEQLASLTFSDRLLFIGLWLEADKAGRLEDRPLRLKASLFPYDDLNIDEALDRLQRAALIVRYERGIRLIVIPGWEKHQRPNHREPESELPGLSDDTGTPGHAQAEGKGREGKGIGREGKGTTALTREAGRARFDRFWAEYPKKEGKDAAWREWLQRSPDDDLTDLMITKVRELRASAQWLKDGGQFIPQPRTWLHQGRWQDEGVNVPHLKEQTVKNVEAVRRWAEQ